MNILHITDLHFGRDPSEAASDERQLALDQLINTIDELHGTWRPTVICLSGDVSFGGQPEEYQFAAAWLTRLMSKLRISPTNLVICPGNHDVERSIATTFARPSNPQEADQCLVTPIPDQYQRVFANFSQFCENIGMPKYSLGDLDGYLTGYRCIDGVRFISLNSSWFCRDKEDSQRLWIGLPLLRHLEANGQWPKQAELCVVLLHHPREDLNPHEIHSYSNRLNTFDYICERCDILLSGHSHGEAREPDQVASRALVFTGGAAYAGADYSNTFQLLKLTADKVQYRAFGFDPKLRSWQAASDAKQRPIGLHSAIVSSPSSEGKSLSIWKESSLAEARRIRESKSRAVRPTGDLPRWIARQVTILRIDTRSLEPNKKSLHNLESPTWPLYQAVRRTPGRKVLLLGDLGTGKSTLLCEFVEQTLTENPNSVTFIVPASSLRLPTSPTLKELISDLTRYFNEQVGVSSSPIDLHTVLADGIELTVVVDGLDEMNLVSASKLLAQLATATEHWPTIQIVAASRPVELHGLDYSAWNVLTTLRVTQSERRLMFRNELEAAGATSDLDEKAERLDEQIAQLPAVVDLLSSPLAVGLFFPRLQDGFISADVTLGDLLIDTLEERLGSWAERDSKQSITPQLDHVLPTPRSKARLLGEALIAFPKDAEITREMLITRLEAAPSIVNHPSRTALANEAFGTYAVAGIFQGSSNLSFPVQAFREIGFAYGVAFSQTPDLIKEKRRDIWREVSFAAAICRRAGTLDDRRSEFEQYGQELLRDKAAIAASAHIVAESQDHNLAKSHIGHLRQLGSHPLNVGVEDLIGSSRVIATAIRLAGEVGVTPRIILLRQRSRFSK